MPWGAYKPGFGTATVIAFYCVASFAGPVLAQESLGPLRTAEQNPLYRLLGTPEAEGADVIDEGSLRLELSTSYSNVFEVSTSSEYGHLFDLEQMVNAVTARYGVREGIEIGATAGMHTGWGGFLDSFISGFHDFFGLPNGGREQRPEGEYRLFLARSGQATENEVRVDVGKKVWFEDVQVFGKWRFHGDDSAPLAASLSGVVRGAAGPLDAGRFGGSAAVLARWSPGPLHVHGSAGVALLTPPDEVDPVARKATQFFTVAAERELWWEGTSFLAQLGGSSAYVRSVSGGDLRGVPLNLVFGFAGLTDGGWGWQLSFAEDILADGPSVDFTVDLEVSRLFGREGATAP